MLSLRTGCTDYTPLPRTDYMDCRGCTPLPRRDCRLQRFSNGERSSFWKPHRRPGRMGCRDCTHWRNMDCKDCRLLPHMDCTDCRPLPHMDCTDCRLLPHTDCTGYRLSPHTDCTDYRLCAAHGLHGLQAFAAHGLHGLQAFARHRDYMDCRLQSRCPSRRRPYCQLLPCLSLPQAQAVRLLPLTAGSF